MTGIITMAFGGWDGGRNIYDDSEILIHGEENWMPGTKLIFFQEIDLHFNINVFFS